MTYRDARVAICGRVTRIRLRKTRGVEKPYNFRPSLL